MTRKARLRFWAATVVCLPWVVLSVFAPDARADGREGSRVPRVYDISDLLEEPTGLGGSLVRPEDEFRRRLGPAGYLNGKSEEPEDAASGFWPKVAEAEPIDDDEGGSGGLDLGELDGLMGKYGFREVGGGKCRLNVPFVTITPDCPN